jgi:hypothetical protein
MGVAKSRMQKNRVIIIQKEKRQSGLSNNDPVLLSCFITLLFATHIFEFFLKFQTLKKYQANLIN